MNGIVNQYENTLQKKRAQTLVVLLVFATIVCQPQVCIYMHIAILCLKVEWK